MCRVILSQKICHLDPLITSLRSAICRQFNFDFTITVSMGHNDNVSVGVGSPDQFRDVRSLNCPHGHCDI